MKIRNYVAKHARKFNKSNIHRNRKKFYKKIKHRRLTDGDDGGKMGTQSTDKGEN